MADRFEYSKGMKAYIRERMAAGAAESECRAHGAQNGVRAMEHTPGPWRYEEGTHTIRAVPSNYWIATMDSWDGAIDSEANAALIAESPELYEHLRTALEWLDNLEQRFGLAGIVDSMPNDRTGRAAWRKALERASAE